MALWLAKSSCTSSFTPREGDIAGSVLVSISPPPPTPWTCSTLFPPLPSFILVLFFFFFVIETCFKLSSKSKESPLAYRTLQVHSWTDVGLVAEITSLKTLVSFSPMPACFTLCWSLFPQPHTTLPMPCFCEHSLLPHHGKKAGLQFPAGQLMLPFIALVCQRLAA